MKEIKAVSKRQSKLRSFLNELLLYSGQYALFYVIMNFSKEGIFYFQDKGHTLLLFILALQTIFLVYFGHKAFWRFLGSLIAPLFYTIIEYELDFQFAFNIAHIFFWFFSIPIGLIQAIQIKTERIAVKKVNEILITFLNILIFLFIYFYFDLKLGLEELLLDNSIDSAMYAERLTIFFLGGGILTFLTDPAHIYILVGGVILALSLAIGRVEILELNEEIKRLFGRYIDKGIRDRILRDGSGVSEKTEVCVLFSDIRNFTSISERFNPEEITAMLNLYFTEWELLSREFGGIIDKYIGDAVMMIFRDDQERASERAALCALSMLKSLPEIKDKLEEKGLPVLQDIGIGLHYGPVIAGDIGSRNRVDYTYIGDSVNIASRLEGVCKDIPSNLVVSHAVYQDLPGKLQEQFSRNKEDIYLKGKAQPIQIFFHHGKVPKG